jgi:hypothetical protein
MYLSKIGIEQFTETQPPPPPNPPFTPLWLSCIDENASPDGQNW